MPPPQETASSPPNITCPFGSSGNLSKLMGLPAIDIFDGISSFMALFPLIPGDRSSMICSILGNSVVEFLVGPILGSVNGPTAEEKCIKDVSGGSGPYKARYLEDPTLANHTIYVPEKPPPVKMPIIAWANGFCLPTGQMYANFLSEIASHGYMVIANGRIDTGGKLYPSTRDSELIKSIDWATTNPAARQYGNLDTKAISVAGQSCGGLNAV
jgi:hypothetical protein